MRIGAYDRVSTVDYPGELSCAIFLVGCNFNCGYCHNPSLISGDGTYIPKEEVMEYLKLRKDVLDGVCISGGEPTCNSDLKEFIKEIKELGYKVKLDTNGTNPKVIKELLDEKLLDYVAMDIKAPPKKYNEVTRSNVNLELIKSTIKILENSGVKHEFRTTYLPTLDEKDIEEITDAFVGKNSKYFIQQFRNIVTNDPMYHELIPHKRNEVMAAVEVAKNHIGVCGVRGI